MKPRKLRKKRWLLWAPPPKTPVDHTVSRQPDSFSSFFPSFQAKSTYTSETSSKMPYLGRFESSPWGLARSLTREKKTKEDMQGSCKVLRVPHLFPLLHTARPVRWSRLELRLQRRIRSESRTVSVDRNCQHASPSSSTETGRRGGLCGPEGSFCCFFLFFSLLFLFLRLRLPGFDVRSCYL